MCGDVNVRANRYLHKSTISAIKLCSHVNSLSMELGILTNKNKSSALQLLQVFCQVFSPV